MKLLVRRQGATAMAYSKNRDPIPASPRAELPEVETLRRGLSAGITDRYIVSMRVLDSKIVPGHRESSNVTSPAVL